MPRRGIAGGAWPRHRKSGDGLDTVASLRRLGDGRLRGPGRERVFDRRGAFAFGRIEGGHPGCTDPGACNLHADFHGSAGAFAFLAKANALLFRPADAPPAAVGESVKVIRFNTIAGY